MLRSGLDPLLILGGDLRVQTSNEAYYRTFNVSPTETEGKFIYDLANRQWNLPKLRQLLEDILPRNSSFKDFEIKGDFEGIGQRTLLLNAHKLSEGDGRQRILLGILDVTEISQLKAAAVENAARLQVLADNIPILCWTADANGSIFWYNQRWFDYTGTTLEEMQGWGWRAVHHPDHVDRVVTKIKQSFDTGEAWDDAFPLRSKNGEYRWFLSRALPIHDDQGKIVRWFGTNTDITERLNAERRQQLLTKELAHRGKNLFAVIQSIVSRSLSGTQSLAEAREALMQRVQALARSQTILVNGAFEGAPLAEIVRLEFEAFPGRVTAAGPDVMLNPKATQTFALLAHELATNATKYGALSQPSGRVAINWSVEDNGAEARFRFQWQERDGPLVVPPTRQGFGRVLIEKAAAQDFGAQPKVSYAPEGLSYEIDALLSAVAARGDGRS